MLRLDGGGREGSCRRRTGLDFPRMGAFDPLPLPLKHRRFTAEQYQRMGEIGVLAPDARVELIDGEIIDKAPISSRDWATVNRISLALKKEGSRRRAGSGLGAIQLPARRP